MVFSPLCEEEGRDDRKCLFPGKEEKEHSARTHGGRGKIKFIVKITTIQEKRILNVGVWVFF